VEHIDRGHADPVRELGFRRGYGKAAAVVVSAVAAHITTEQAEKLQDWLAEVSEWQGFASGLEHEPPDIPSL
jgi:hypothetical protein